MSRLCRSVVFPLAAVVMVMAAGACRRELGASGRREAYRRSEADDGRKEEQTP